MSTVKDKWKKSFKKALTRKDSHESIGSIASSISVLDEETDEMELQSYINSMKKKTGLLNLWSGNKFENIIENDKTPDISIDSDDDDMLNSKIRNLQMIDGLDSDEDEMRIDYLREIKLKDENNNNVESESESESLNLMGNVQFAELALNDVSLSDNETSKEDDYLPILNEPMLRKSERSSTDDSYDFNKNIHILNNSASDNTVATDQSDNTKGVSPDGLMKNDLSVASPVYTEDEISKMSEHRFDVFSDNSTKSNNSKGSRSSKSRTTKSSTYKSLSRNTNSSKSSNKTKSSSHKTSSSAKVSKSDDNSTLSDATFSSTHSSETKNSSQQKARKKSKSKSKHNMQTQTDYTDKVLNFKYNWQITEPSNIAAHVVEPMAIDVLTNYNPAVLAANDMMKFHMELLTKHIQNSRRLYEAYAAESVNSNYKYTTVEDTFGYIERNKPKVLTYKQALRKVKGDNT